MITLSFDSISNEGHRNIVMIDKILYLSKKNEGITEIHLVTGEILETYDSINTLEARIETEEE